MSIKIFSTDDEVIVFSGSLESFCDFRSFIASRLGVPHYDVTKCPDGRWASNVEIISNRLSRDLELNRLTIENSVAAWFLRLDERNIEMTSQECFRLAVILHPIEDDQWDHITNQFIAGLDECANKDLSIRSTVEF